MTRAHEFSSARLITVPYERQAANSGEKVGEAMINLAAGTRFSRTVDQLVPSSAGQAGGFIRVTSDKGLIGQQLFGTSTLSLLSAVPPKVVSLAN